MQIRAATDRDIELLCEIDGTVESAQYLFLERSGEGTGISWRLEARALRDKLIQSNPISDESAFTLRQILGGIDEGIVLVAEHQDRIIGMVLARPDPAYGTMELLDLRIDYDFRRQGLATVMVYQIIEQARQRELRAVRAETRTNNFPANQLLQKLGFDLGGLDTARRSNHDLVKETATLIWYAALD